MLATVLELERDVSNNFFDLGLDSDRVDSLYISRNDLLLRFLHFTRYEHLYPISLIFQILHLTCLVRMSYFRSVHSLVVGGEASSRSDYTLLLLLTLLCDLLRVLDPDLTQTLTLAYIVLSIHLVLNKWHS